MSGRLDAKLDERKTLLFKYKKESPYANPINAPVPIVTTKEYIFIRSS